MRKRSSYRPRPVCFDTMAFVKETLEPIHTRAECTTFKLRNHQAMAALAQGNGTRRDVDVVIDALNVTEALALLNVGKDWATEIRAAQDALYDMATRSLAAGNRFVFKAVELTAVNMAMEVHDAQLDTVNVGQLLEAVKMVRSVKRSGHLRVIA